MATRDDGAFPEVDAAKQLNLGVPEQFPVDPVSSEVGTARDHHLKATAEEGAKEAEQKGKKCRCPISGNLRTAMVVTGVVAIAVGVAFIVTKKLKKA